MATEQLHVPIDAWLSGKISIGPRRDPQIMTDFQMQVMDVRGVAHVFTAAAGGFYYVTAYPNHPVSALLCTTDQRRIQYSRLPDRHQRPEPSACLASLLHTLSQFVFFQRPWDRQEKEYGLPKNHFLKKFSENAFKTPSINRSV